MKKLGLYLHIPFCKSKCRYCDFCSFPSGNEETVRAYVGRLCSDLADRSGECSDYEVDSIYFGGGTPTVLNSKQFASVMETVCGRYHITSDCEITAECNPATGGKELFRDMRQLGFNRLSIGLQSTHREELRTLGRIHTYEEFLITWEEARSAGFDNLSADVMFGIPYQTEDSFRETLERVLALSPEHLSAYALTVEAGTPFEKMVPNLPMPGEDATANMYLNMVDYLSAHGLHQYEISNFSKEGRASRHNLKYWNLGEYLGFGPAAHSDFRGERFGNGRDLDGYLAGRDILSEQSRPSVAERKNEYVMLRLRLAEGLRRREYLERFGEEPGAFFEKLRPYIRSGLATESEDGISLLPRGFLVSNAILSEVVSFPSEISRK